jgi:hypothetical protein
MVDFLKLSGDNGILLRGKAGASGGDAGGYRGMVTLPLKDVIRLPFGKHTNFTEFVVSILPQFLGGQG